MSAFLWSNELREAKIAEREQALEQISHLIKAHEFKVDEIIPLLKTSLQNTDPINFKEPSRLFDPFFDA